MWQMALHESGSSERFCMETSLYIRRSSRIQTSHFATLDRMWSFGALASSITRPIYALICLLWGGGHIKTLEYEILVDSVEELVARIVVSFAEVRDLPGIFQNLQNSVFFRCHTCITIGGRNFEYDLCPLPTVTFLMVNS